MRHVDSPGVSLYGAWNIKSTTSENEVKHILAFQCFGIKVLYFLNAILIFIKSFLKS